jgi:hypothetical protein
MYIKLAKRTSRSLVACGRIGKLLLVVHNDITHMIKSAHHDEGYGQCADERHHAEVPGQVGHREYKSPNTTLSIDTDTCLGFLHWRY